MFLKKKKVSGHCTEIIMYHILDLDRETGSFTTRHFWTIVHTSSRTHSEQIHSALLFCINTKKKHVYFVIMHVYNIAEGTQQQRVQIL